MLSDDDGGNFEWFPSYLIELPQWTEIHFEL